MSIIISSGQHQFADLSETTFTRLTDGYAPDVALRLTTPQDGADEESVVFEAYEIENDVVTAMLHEEDGRNDSFFLQFEGSEFRTTAVEHTKAFIEREQQNGEGDDLVATHIAGDDCGLDYPVLIEREDL